MPTGAGVVVYQVKLPTSTQYPIWMLVRVTAAPLLIQLPANGLAKAAEGDSSTCSPTTLVEHPEEAPSFIMINPWIMQPSEK